MCFLYVCCFQGAVLCDIILLNFLKGADQYKARKFEEVCFFSTEIPISSGFLSKIKTATSVFFFFCSRCQMHTLKNHPPTTSPTCTGPETIASCQSDLKTNSLMTQGLFPLASMVNNIFRTTSSNT